MAMQREYWGTHLVYGGNDQPNRDGPIPALSPPPTSGHLVGVHGLSNGPQQQPACLAKRQTILATRLLAAVHVSLQGKFAATSA